MNYSSQLKELTDCLISNDSTWQEKRNCLIQMSHLFAKLDIYDINANLSGRSENGIHLENGYAIDSWGAAMCLMEVARTRTFVAGIIAAIKDLLKKSDQRPLQIVDAGCGPFALLSLLPSFYFSDDEVCFHLLDVIPENTIAAKKLIHQLQLEKKFGDIYTADATKFKWDKPLPLHMVISETMLNALRKEPQVAITMNLAPQLTQEGIFIPEEIKVDLVRTWPMHTIALTQQAAQNERGIEPIAPLLTITKHSFNQLGASVKLPVVKLPDSYDCNKDNLAYHTNIIVYKDYILTGNDCSLTLPFNISTPYKNTIEKGVTLSFTYTTIQRPGIIYTIN